MNMANSLHRRDAEVAQRFTESFSLRISVSSLCLCGKKLFLVLFLFLIASCLNTEIKPVEIAPEDVCTHCKMAISEKQFAAEFITPDGDAFKFDDIGCLLDYLKEKQETKAATYFFVDYETKKWVQGSAATFAKSDEITSPMSGGIIAFQDKAKAAAAATKYKGKILGFEELTKK